MTSDFDISSILEFRPPSYICPACRGFFRTLTVTRTSEPPYSCPVCKVGFIVDTWGKKSVPQMFNYGNHRIPETDMLAHARHLAKTVKDAEGSTPIIDPWPTMRLLLEILGRAKFCVHFTSWGISHLLIGTLKATSVRVPVYGLVSSVEDHARRELIEYPAEAPNLNVCVIPSSQGIYDAPHQKLVIVDGLVAFKGSTNLTNAGMRRADRALDVTEVETNVGRVSNLNNRYFAPVWKRLNAPDDTYAIDWAPF
jgi:hypothetical protein